MSIDAAICARIMMLTDWANGCIHWILADHKLRSGIVNRVLHVYFKHLVVCTGVQIIIWTSCFMLRVLMLKLQMGRLVEILSAHPIITANWTI